MRKTIYERRKGKQMHASESWSVTSAERRLINAVAIFFAASVIAVLVSGFVHKGWFLTASIICCATSFILMFAVLFVLVFKKSREKPMETHYYDVDYRYNGITGQTGDRTMEISKDEFLYGKESKDKYESLYCHKENCSRKIAAAVFLYCTLLLQVSVTVC